MSAPTPSGQHELGRVAHYNLLERLEPAGPGELFRARDTHRGRTVVIRLMPAPDAVVLEQAQAFSRVSHPNTITVFDAGEHDGRPYVAFEFVRGQSLRAEMSGRPMNVRRAIELAIQIADAVAEAHALGYVHGGLSPETIGITAKGHAKIPAFELATTSGFEGQDVSKLRDYPSPEESRGERGDDRSDIYSVGSILYEMLTTRRPPPRGAAAPSAANTHVPKELDDVVLKAVAPNPDLRYQSAATLASELRSLGTMLDARGGAGDEDDLPEPAANFGRSVVLLALVILAAIGLVAWWFTRS